MIQRPISQKQRIKNLASASQSHPQLEHNLHLKPAFPHCNMNLYKKKGGHQAMRTSHEQTSSFGTWNCLGSCTPFYRL